jgi:hypothetical protein
MTHDESHADSNSKAPAAHRKGYRSSCRPRRRLRGEPLGAITRLGVWLVVQKIADRVRRVPPKGAWLWRLRE